MLVASRTFTATAAASTFHGRFVDPLQSFDDTETCAAYGFTFDVDTAGADSVRVRHLVRV